MQGKGKTIALVGLLLLLAAAAAYMYWPEKVETAPPVAPAAADEAPAPKGRPARPADEPPTDAPNRGGTMSG
jgi:hypothetical protein